VALKAAADLNAANEALAKVSSELGVKDGFADAITKLKNSKYFLNCSHIKSLVREFV
jgi:hypothetical protein